ncbi:LysR family transcriptional regulator, partial [Vibrio anguillarum]|nr:LysR family transcriptional regulator [Vibrio anguillarum]MBF4388218.1 LysR family transcriptional regulator [Vibrio anguillarum]MBF4402164.1 LysR family transcriptional regulator [Vibrio anguillarum]
MTITFVMIVLFYAHLASILVYTYFYQRAFTMDISQVTYFCLCDLKSY